MKTKNKILAVVEIAIVLCSVLLVALPAIVAEQTTQEVGATITTASEDDYALDIYGNANEDDTIDMRDLTYVKLIFFGKKPETELADAKYDGKINPLDFIQIKLIIVGKEKELTVIDAADRTVTLNKPIERIVCAGMVQDIRTICALGAVDKIVGTATMNKGTLEEMEFYFVFLEAYPELKELPTVGICYSPSIEVIASMEPDLVIANYRPPEYADTIQETTGIPAIIISTSQALDFKWFRFMGYVLNERERAEELISYLSEKIEEVTEVTYDIPDYEKPKIYLASWTYLGTITYTPSVYTPVELAGGINVAEDPGTYGPYGPDMWQVSKEQIIAWNPDIILIHCGFAMPIEDVLSDPDLQTITAIKNKDVYYTKGHMYGWDPATGVVEASCYMPKLFHPDEFADLDVEEVGNEILEEVYGADGLWTEMSERFDLYTW